MFIKKNLLPFLLLGIASLNSCKDQGNTGGLAGLFSTEEPATPTEIHNLADLEGKRVGALTGGMFPTVLKPLQPGIAEYRDYNYTQLMMQALRKGKIDAVLEDEPIALLWSAYYPEELYLAAHVQITNFVQKDGSLVGQLETSHSV